MFYLLVLNFSAGVYNPMVVAPAIRPSAEIVFSPGTPRRGARANEITAVVEYENASGAAKIEIILQTKVTFLGFQLPVSIASASGDVQLPKGAWSANLASLKRGAVVTRAIAKIKDQEGKVIAETWVNDLRIDIPK